MSFSVFALIAFIGVGGMLISCHNGYSSEPEREMCAYCFGFHGMIYSIVFWLVGIVAISLWDSIRNEKTMEGK